MATTVANLTAVISVDPRNLQRGLEEARAQVEAFANSVSEQFSAIANRTQGIATAAATAGREAGIGLEDAATGAQVQFAILQGQVELLAASMERLKSVKLPTLPAGGITRLAGALDAAAGYSAALGHNLEGVFAIATEVATVTASIRDHLKEAAGAAISMGKGVARSLAEPTSRGAGSGAEGAAKASGTPMFGDVGLFAQQARQGATRAAEEAKKATAKGMAEGAAEGVRQAATVFRNAAPTFAARTIRIGADTTGLASGMARAGILMGRFPVSLRTRLLAETSGFGNQLASARKSLAGLGANPIVTRLNMDTSAFMRGANLSEGILRRLTVGALVRLGIDDRVFGQSIVRVSARLRQIIGPTKARVTLDDSQAIRAIPGVVERLKAIGAEHTVLIRAQTSDALAALESLGAKLRVFGQGVAIRLGFDPSRVQEGFTTLGARFRLAGQNIAAQFKRIIQGETGSIDYSAFLARLGTVRQALRGFRETASARLGLDFSGFTRGLEEAGARLREFNLRSVVKLLLDPTKFTAALETAEQRLRAFRATAYARLGLNTASFEGALEFARSRLRSFGDRATAFLSLDISRFTSSLEVARQQLRNFTLASVMALRLDTQSFLKGLSNAKSQLKAFGSGVITRLGVDPSELAAGIKLAKQSLAQFAVPYTAQLLLGVEQFQQGVDRARGALQNLRAAITPRLFLNVESFLRSASQAFTWEQILTRPLAAVLSLHLPTFQEGITRARDWLSSLAANAKVTLQLQTQYFRSQIADAGRLLGSLKAHTVTARFEVDSSGATREVTRTKSLLAQLAVPLIVPLRMGAQAFNLTFQAVSSAVQRIKEPIMARLNLQAEQFLTQTLAAQASVDKLAHSFQGGTVVVDANVLALKAMASQMSLIDKLAISAGTAWGNFKKQLEQVRNTLAATSQAIGETGRAMTYAFTLPFVAGVALAVKAASELQQKVQEIKTVKPNIDVSQVFDALAQMQTRVPMGVKELGDSLYQVFSKLNITQREGLALTEQFAHGATASLTNMDTYTRALTGAMVTYRMGLNEATHATDVFQNTVAHAAVRGPELAEGMGRVLNASHGLGISFNETMAAIAATTRQAGTARQNMMYFAESLRSIGKVQIQRELASIGVKIYDLHHQIRPLNEILGDLKIALSTVNTEKAQQALSAIFSGQRSANSIRAIMNNLEFMRDRLKENASAAGVAEKAFQTMLESPENQMKIFVGSLRALFESLGKFLMPAVIPVIQSLTKSLNGAFDELKARLASVSVETRQAWFNFGLFAAAIGPVLILVAGLTTLIATLATPLGLTMLAVVALAAAWVVDFGHIREATTATVQHTVGAFEKIKTFIRDTEAAILGSVRVIQILPQTLLRVFEALSAASVGDWGRAKSELQIIGKEIAATWKAGFQESASDISSGPKKAADSLKGVVQSHTQGVQKMATETVTAIKNAWKQLGMTPTQISAAMDKLPGMADKASKAANKIETSFVEAVQKAREALQKLATPTDFLSQVKVDFPGIAEGRQIELANLKAINVELEKAKTLQDELNKKIDDMNDKASQSGIDLIHSLDNVTGGMLKAGAESAKFQNTLTRMGEHLEKATALGKSLPTAMRAATAATEQHAQAAANVALAWKDTVKSISAAQGLKVISEFRNTRTRSGKKSLHATGEALDIAGSEREMSTFFNTLKTLYQGHIKELFYSGEGGGFVKNNIPLTAEWIKKNWSTGVGIVSDHFTHVHVALEKFASAAVQSGNLAGIMGQRFKSAAGQLSEFSDAADQIATMQGLTKFSQDAGQVIQKMALAEATTDKQRASILYFGQAVANADPKVQGLAARILALQLLAQKGIVDQAKWEQAGADFMALAKMAEGAEKLREAGTKAFIGMKSLQDGTEAGRMALDLFNRSLSSLPQNLQDWIGRVVQATQLEKLGESLHQTQLELAAMNATSLEDVTAIQLLGQHFNMLDTQGQAVTRSIVKMKQEMEDTVPFETLRKHLHDMDIEMERVRLEATKSQFTRTNEGREFNPLQTGPAFQTPPDQTFQREAALAVGTTMDRLNRGVQETNNSFKEAFLSADLFNQALAAIAHTDAEDKLKKVVEIATKMKEIFKFQQEQEQARLYKEYLDGIQKTIEKSAEELKKAQGQASVTQAESQTRMASGYEPQIRAIQAVSAAINQIEFSPATAGLKSFIGAWQGVAAQLEAPRKKLEELQLQVIYGEKVFQTFHMTLEQVQEAIMGAVASGSDMTEIFVTLQKLYAASKMDQLAEQTKQSAEVTAQLQEKMASMGQTVSELGGRINLYRKALEDLGLVGKQLTPDQQSMVVQIMNKMPKVEAIKFFADQMKSIFHDALLNLSKGFGSFFQSVIQGFENMLRDMAAKWLASQISNFFVNALGKVFGAGFGEILQGRAGGGDVNAGQPYMVGERGPELVVPRSSGSVVNNQALMSMLAGAGAGASNGPVYNISLNVHGVQDAGSFKRNQAQIFGDLQRQLDFHTRRSGKP